MLKLMVDTLNNQSDCRILALSCYRLNDVTLLCVCSNEATLQCW